MDDLEEIKKKKLEQLKKQYMKGEKTMENKWPDTPIQLLDADIDGGDEEISDACDRLLGALVWPLPYDRTNYRGTRNRNERKNRVWEAEC